MKILLLGDFSGFHSNLKEGLNDLGHEVDLATSGDSYKKISKTDLQIPKGKLEKILFLFKGIRKYYGYDIVQLAKYNNFGSIKMNYNYFVQKRIKKHNGLMFLSSCGNNPFTYRIKNVLRYNPYDLNIEIDKNGINDYEYPEKVKEIDRVSKLADGIIPIMYTYKLAYEKYSNLLNTIPLPINVNKVKFIPQNIEVKKIKIFHGITRVGFKGTKFILEAMEKLKENYPDDVEIIIGEKMSLEKYLKVLEETNVVVDQAFSYEYGMNALYSMAMGKVVLSGNEPECQQEFGRTDIPVINIKPYVDDIYNKLEKLVLNKEEIVEIGKKSREFVEDFHSHIKVAQQYIDVWNSVGGNKNGR
jgi:glycosyltransferase involved in cell wall biosynthesis